MRWLRGLGLGLSLSLLNLAGAFLTLLLIGGLGEWTPARFVGLFGVLEIGTGIAFLFCPNVWRLPVVRAEAPDTRVRLAAAAVFDPHWAGGVKALMGLGFVVYAGVVEGWGIASLLLAAFSVLVAGLTLLVSAAVAAFGVHFYRYDVVYFAVRRPGRDIAELPGLSLSAALLQIVLGALVLPAVKLMPPSTLFRGEVFAPSAPTLWIPTVAVLVFTAVVAGAWWGSFSWHASARQQRIAEERAA